MGGTYRVHFKGGPLGGETQEIDKSMLTGARILVPARHRFRDWVGNEFPEMHTTLTEMYELEHGIAPGEYTARWVHQQDTLIRENRKLKERIRELERADRVLDLFRELKHLL